MVARKAFHNLSGILLIGILVMACAGCGSSSSHNLSQAQVQAISHEMATAVEAAVQAAIPADAAVERAPRSSLAKAVSDLQPDQLPGCTTSGTTTTCNFSMNSSTNCPDGGTIGVAGTFDFTLNSGSGSDSTTLTVTPTNCNVGSNLTINGDPNVMLSTTLTFANEMIVFPATLSEKGGITYGPNPSGSCSVDATYTVTSPTSCTVSGTMCGQTLSGNC